LNLSPRMRWKFDQIRKKFGGLAGDGGDQPRPQLCPACRTLVGAGATRCHNCGANMRFSMAAASRSLGRLMPTASPATYGILTLSCLMFLVSLLATVPKSAVLFGFGYFAAGYYPLFERHLVITTIGMCAIGVAAIAYFLARAGAIAPRGSGR